MNLSLCSSMIFSGSRFPLFQIMPSSALFQGFYDLT
jgi:hypothetical protein